MKTPMIALALAAMLTSPPASARWDDISDEDRCGFANSWELGHNIVFLKHMTTEEEIMSDDVLLAVHHKDWSLSNGDEIDFTLKFEDDEGAAFWNTPVAVKNGLLMYVDFEIIEHLRMSNGVSIYRDKEEIASLDWSGFLVGWWGFKSCVDKFRAPILEQRRLDRIRSQTPRDPFAKTEDANREQIERNDD